MQFKMEQYQRRQPWSMNCIQNFQILTDICIFIYKYVRIVNRHDSFLCEMLCFYIYLYIYFLFQQLHLIELIRANKLEEALHFAQEQLSEAGESDPNALVELERTLALLAFEEPLLSPFSDLLQPSHRQKVCILYYVYIYNKLFYIC